MELEVAAHAAVGADGGGDLLRRLVPAAVRTPVEFALEHQRPGGAHPDAVAAVDARRIRQQHCELGRDPRVETPSRHREREGVLGILAAGLNTLVAEDALAVIANVEVVVQLDRLRHRGAVSRLDRLVVSRRMAVTLPGGAGWCGRAVALGISGIFGQPFRHLRSGREVHRRREELQHHLPAVAHPVAAGPYLHARLHLPGAARHQHPRALDLHHAYPAHVHRMKCVEVAERRDVDAGTAAGVEDGAAFGRRNRGTVDGDLDALPERLDGNERGHDAAAPSKSRSRLMAVSTAP